MSFDVGPKDLLLVGTIARAFREGAVERCLKGNDTQCFTTEQYQDAYDEENDKAFRTKCMPNRWANGLAEKHLRSLPDLVQEVRPGVWAAKERAR